MSNHHFEKMEKQPKLGSPEYMEAIITEIRGAAKMIEDMVGKTDIVPDHLESALQDARTVADKYEFTDGDEDFDVALDILVDTIKNTELLEEEVARRFSDKAGAVE